MPRFLFLIATLSLIVGCSRPDSVVLYASVDRQLAEPVVSTFEENSLLDVKAVFDVEANKTVGLVNRLTAERATPRADVFWSGEFARTIELCERGVLQPIVIESPRVAEPTLDDPQGCWFLFAARLRVFLVHDPSKTENASVASLSDLVSRDWHGRACIANPRFGTTATHFAGLLTRWGDTRFRQWLRDLRANAVAILPGNAQVKESVSRGACALGLTDTDDALTALAERAPVQFVIPDQETGGIGVFMIPSTVAAVAGGPNPAGGTQLIQFLLSEEGERQLASGPGGFLPVRHRIEGPVALPAVSNLSVMRVDYVAIAHAIPAMLQILDEEWPH